MRSEKLSGCPEEFTSRIMELVHEANVKRIAVKQGEKTVLDIPLSAGVVGALLSPWLVAVAVFGAILTGCTIEIEQK